MGNVQFWTCRKLYLESSPISRNIYFRCDYEYIYHDILVSEKRFFLVT